MGGWVRGCVSTCVRACVHAVCVCVSAHPCLPGIMSTFGVQLCPGKGASGKREHHSTTKHLSFHKAHRFHLGWRRRRVSLDLGGTADEGKQVLHEQEASPFSLSPTQPPPHGESHALYPVGTPRQSLPRHRTHWRRRASKAAGKSGAKTLKCPWSIIFCIVLSGLPWWSATRSARLTAVNDLSACGTAGRTTSPCAMGVVAHVGAPGQLRCRNLHRGAARTRDARRDASGTPVRAATARHASARGNVTLSLSSDPLLRSL